MKKTLFLAMFFLGLNIVNAQKIKLDLALSGLAENVDSAVILISFETLKECQEHFFIIKEGEIQTNTEKKKGLYKLCRESIPDGVVLIQYEFWQGRKSFCGYEMKKIKPGYHYIIEPLREKWEINTHWYYWEIEFKPNKHYERRRKQIIYFDAMVYHYRLKNNII